MKIKFIYITLLFNLNISAQPYYSFPIISQKYDTWCQFACVEMIYNYYTQFHEGENTTELEQCSMLQIYRSSLPSDFAIDQSYPCCNEATIEHCNTPEQLRLPDDNCAEYDHNCRGNWDETIDLAAVRLVSPHSESDFYTTHYSLDNNCQLIAPETEPGDFNMQFVSSQLDKYGPMLVTHNFTSCSEQSNRGNHMVLVIGYRYFNASCIFSKRVPYIYFNDPNGCEKTQCWNFNDFKYAPEHIYTFDSPNIDQHQIDSELGERYISPYFVEYFSNGLRPEGFKGAGFYEKLDHNEAFTDNCLDHFSTEEMVNSKYIPMILCEMHPKVCKEIELLKEKPQLEKFPYFLTTNISDFDSIFINSRIKKGIQFSELTNEYITTIADKSYSNAICEIVFRRNIMNEDYHLSRIIDFPQDEILIQNYKYLRNKYGKNNLAIVHFYETNEVQILVNDNNKLIIINLNNFKSKK